MQQTIASTRYKFIQELVSKIFGHADWVDEEEKRSHLRKINAHLDVREYA